MKYKENLGATCSNCANLDGKNKKACRKCANFDGMLGWEPAQGVQTNVFPVFSGPNMAVEYCRQVVREA